MNVIDITSFPTLEALVFDYVTIPFFNIWTCLAVLTATISFWKLRSTSSAAPPPPPTEPATSSSSESTYSPSPETSSPSPQVVAAAAAESSSDYDYVYRRFEYDGVTKGEFVARYEDEDGGDDGGRSGGDDERFGDAALTATVTEWWRSWERVGWYNYQDLTMINGNVVRLWDDVKRRRRSSVVNLKKNLTELSLDCCCFVDY